MLVFLGRFDRVDKEPDILSECVDVNPSRVGACEYSACWRIHFQTVGHALPFENQHGWQEMSHC